MEQIHLSTYEEFEDYFSSKVKDIHRRLQMLMQETNHRRKRIEQISHQILMLKRNMNQQTEKMFNEEECVMCWHNEANVKFLPCYHRCLCSGCLPSYQEKFDCCPMCRRQYENVTKVQ